MFNLNLNLLVLKVLALFFMIIDHLIILYPQHLWLRIIGRLSFPIYVYLLTVGLNKSKNQTKYIFKLLLWGILSQPIYALFWKTSLNILLAFSFYLSIGKINESLTNKWQKKCVIFLGLVGSDLLKLDYGTYGLSLFYIFWKWEKLYIPVGMLGISILKSITFPFQLFAVFSLPIIFISQIKTYEVRVPNWVFQFQSWAFYISYPLHLVVIYYLRQLIT